MATQPPSLFPVRKNPLYLHDDARTQGGNKLSVSEMMWRNMRGRGNSNAINPSTGKFMTMQEASSRGPFHTAGYNTSGVGPDTRGYRGSYMHGGYNYGQGTRGPSARNSAEYYSQRDAVTGNPLDWLFMNGPGGRALMDRIVNESYSGESSTNWESMEPMEGESAFDFIKRRDAGGGQSKAPTSPAMPPMSGDVTMQNAGIYDVGGGKRQLFGKYGTGAGFRDAFAFTADRDKTNAATEKRTGMPYSYQSTDEQQFADAFSGDAPPLSGGMGMSSQMPMVPQPVSSSVAQAQAMRDGYSPMDKTIMAAGNRLAPWVDPYSRRVGNLVGNQKAVLGAGLALQPHNIANTIFDTKKKLGNYWKWFTRPGQNAPK